MRVRVGRVCLATILFFFLFFDLGLFSYNIFMNSEAYLEKALMPLPVDETPPTIILKGGDSITIGIDGKYEEPGIEAYDDRTETFVTTEGEVDTSVAGEYMVKYYATDEHNNTSSATRIVKVIEPAGTIYLTFDDGPGPYTANLLDILAKHNVKATFFVTGNGSDDLIKREYDEGHTVALHSFSHDYSYIYRNMDNYFADLYRIQERVKNITGYTSMLIRFPGGSSNTVSTRYDGGKKIMSQLVNEVGNRGFTYFDWNVASGDAANISTADGIYESVTNALISGGNSIVLQHDIKSFSVDAVERIILYGKENGYVFSRLDDSSFTAHHGVNN